MFSFFTEHEYMPCVECGQSLARTERETHVCDERRRLDYEVFQLREAIERFDVDLGAYLTSPRGRFEKYYAERDRRARS